MENFNQAEHTSNLTKEQLVNWYMTDILEGRDLKNVYLFSKNHEISESDFYVLFNDFSGIEKHFFVLLFDKTMETLKSSDQYATYSTKEKLLSFYYTFFGNLSSNRSFVQYLFKSGKLENLKKLSGLHKKFIVYIRTLDLEKLDLKDKGLNKVQDRAMQESAWIQFISVLKFWNHDQSAGFEKTDIFIEKSVNAAFELMNVKPLKTVADLGRFIFNEFKSVS